MISTHLPDKAYQFAAKYELGEPVRVYKVEPMRLKNLIAGIFIVFLFVMFISLIQGIIQFIQNGFQFDPGDLVPYGISLLVITILGFCAFVANWRMRKTAVYICSAGFIVLDRQQTRAVRWEEIERVEPSEKGSPCVVHLVDSTSVKPSGYIDQQQLLAAELELKAQLGTHPERRPEIERLFNQIQDDPPWLQQAKTRAQHYQEKERLVKQNDPEEAYKLGEEYQFGAVLGTYRATFQSVFVPNAETSVDFSFTLLMLLIMIFPILSPSRGNGSGLWLLFVLGPFVLLRLSARHTRLHFYEEGFIYIRRGAIDVIRWEQVEKAVYAHKVEIFNALCTIHLKESDKVEISKYLTGHRAMKQILQEKTHFEQNGPNSKVEDKDRYRDVGRLAD